MRLLLDECLPKKLRQLLVPHTCVTVVEAGWSGIKNGALLKLAEGQFDVVLTVDRNLRHQQNIPSYNVAVIVMSARKNAIEMLEPLVPQVLEALKEIRPGEVVHVGTPKPRK